MNNFELFRYLKKWWILIMVATACGCIFVYNYVSDNQQYIASAVFEYTNEEAASGKNVDGSDIDLSEITSSSVINRTIEELGLETDADKIRSGVKVEAVISEDEQTKKEVALSDGEDYEYFPTTYEVSFYVDDKDAMEYARNVLDSLLSNYFNYYGENHIDSELFPNNAENVSTAHYEYIDCVEMLRENANETISYLTGKAEQKYNYYSAETGYSFEDLANQYEYVRDNSLAELYARITSNQLVKDIDVLLKEKENEIVQCDIKLENINEHLTEAESIIDRFGEKTLDGQYISDNSSNSSSDESQGTIITNVEDGLYQFSSDSISVNVTTTYDKLILQYADLKSQYIDTNIQRGKAQEILDIYAGVTRNTDPESANAVWASEKIDEIASQFTELYQTSLQTVEEFNQVMGAQNLAMKCSTVVSEKLNLKLYLMLTFVVFFVFGCVLAVFLGRLGDFVDYVLYVDKKTGIPNRERCDSMIEFYANKRLGERFSLCIFQVKLDSLSRTSGDKVLRKCGDAFANVFRTVGFVGYNGAGMFIAMAEKCTTDFAEGCIDQVIRELKESKVENIVYAYGIANSTDDGLYEIRSLIRKARETCNRYLPKRSEKKVQEKPE